MVSLKNTLSSLKIFLSNFVSKMFQYYLFIYLFWSKEKNLGAKIMLIHYFSNIEDIIHKVYTHSQYAHLYIKKNVHVVPKLQNTVIIIWIMYNKNMYYIFTVAKFYKLFLSVRFNSVLLMREKNVKF